MSDKFFFKGKKEKKPKHTSYGFNTKRAAKSGTKESPFVMSVKTDARKVEIEAILKEHDLFAEIEINESAEENIVDLNGFLNKPVTTTFEKKPQRNDPCSCGSEKKYKKCCG
ncbi:PBPRA1643 family SWIM/SEC-C metal-binding motif protein [Psychromonas sp. Urea-02u-13]|uniref:PBPRA1643 family SWIM/SEC-C metal-binding motif protein n=1 Tax=Psychromonas sp. Urea-02u-13 TaxID=2058326 RepID=UPI000C32EAED|nr:PBPRA1643 family SWIM/SEC-C metal-binding motif protein [Psychromonas sp. Urea-02u-13]PKG38263.1 zinc chelation protein SecC [Psychromonas sp. Urea-02u-13]